MAPLKQLERVSYAKIMIQFTNLPHVGVTVLLLVCVTLLEEETPVVMEGEAEITSSGPS